MEKKVVANDPESQYQTAHEGHSGRIRWNYGAGMDGVVLGDVSGINLDVCRGITGKSRIKEPLDV
ncbi:hypothetical protein AKJ16_DCAP14798 [Drosera capensis]